MLKIKGRYIHQQLSNRSGTIAQFLDPKLIYRPYFDVGMVTWSILTSTHKCKGLRHQFGRSHRSWASPLGPPTWRGRVVGSPETAPWLESFFVGLGPSEWYLAWQLFRQFFGLCRWSQYIPLRLLLIWYLDYYRSGLFGTSYSPGLYVCLSGCPSVLPSVCMSVCLSYTLSGGL